jgi:hypothetical protein
MPDDLIARMHAALPSVRQWIDAYIQRHSDQACTVSSLNFRKLSSYFPETLLTSTKIVSVPRVIFPPVHLWGVPEFARLQQMSFDGITFKDAYFLRAGCEGQESLHAHELVHVCQWARLGVDRFLLAYAAGVAHYGYEQSPLERMAFEVQGVFEQGHSVTNLVQAIEQQTDRVWSAAARLVGM